MFENVLEKVMKGPNWSSAVAGFEEHMKEEDEVRVEWQNGKYQMYVPLLLLQGYFEDYESLLI